MQNEKCRMKKGMRDPRFGSGGRGLGAGAEVRDSSRRHLQVTGAGVVRGALAGAQASSQTGNNHPFPSFSIHSQTFWIFYFQPKSTRTSGRIDGRIGQKCENCQPCDFQGNPHFGFDQIRLNSTTFIFMESDLKVRGRGRGGWAGEGRRRCPAPSHEQGNCWLRCPLLMSAGMKIEHFQKYKSKNKNILIKIYLNVIQIKDISICLNKYEKIITNVMSKGIRV